MKTPEQRAESIVPRTEDLCFEFRDGQYDGTLTVPDYAVITKQDTVLINCPDEDPHLAEMLRQAIAHEIREAMKEAVHAYVYGESRMDTV